MRETIRIALCGWLLLSGLTLGGGTWAEPMSSSGGAAVDALVEPWQRAHVAGVVPDGAQDCLTIGSMVQATGVQAEIALSLDLLARAPLGAWLVAQAAARSVMICSDAATNLAAYYLAQTHLIGLLETLGEPAKVVFLAHELAHVPQHPRYSNNRRFGPKAMIVLQRLREAAAEAIATRVLWQLRRRGHGAPWDQKLGTGYGDIARRFARAMAETGDELAATRAAFDQWFAGPRRVDGYDARILDHLMRISDDPMGLVRTSRAVTDRFLRGIGQYAGETFLPPDRGPALTEPDYSDHLSSSNTARLEVILEHAMWPRVPGRS